MKLSVLINENVDYLILNCYKHGTGGSACKIKCTANDRLCKQVVIRIYKTHDEYVERIGQEILIQK